MIDISSRGEVFWNAERAEYDLRIWSPKYKDYSIESIHPGKHGEIEVIGNIYANPGMLEMKE